MEMKTTRVHSLNNFVGYLEAVEDVVKIGNLNYKLVAEDFYNAYCEHLFFATLEVCESDESEFHQILFTEDLKYVRNLLDHHITVVLKYAPNNWYSINFSNLDIKIIDNDNSQPIQTLKDNGWV